MTGKADFTDNEWQVLMAGALLVMLPNVVVFLLAQKHFVKGLVVGGLRG